MKTLSSQQIFDCSKSLFVSSSDRNSLYCHCLCLSEWRSWWNRFFLINFFQCVFDSVCKWNCDIILGMTEWVYLKYWRSKKNGLTDNKHSTLHVNLTRCKSLLSTVKEHYWNLVCMFGSLDFWHFISICSSKLTVFDGSCQNRRFRKRKREKAQQLLSIYLWWVLI